MRRREKRPLPLSFITTTFAASACLAAGVLGLGEIAELEMLDLPAVAWSFIAVGVVMDLWAIAALISWVRESKWRT